MTKYLVITPEYETVIPILDDGTGPSEWGADVLEVDALSTHQARIMAVGEWRRLAHTARWRDAKWIRDADTDNRCPFTGLKVQNMDLDEEEFNRRYYPDEPTP